MRVSVIGGSSCTERVAERARAVGRLLAERDHTLVCGGLGGVMEAACAGAAEAGGEPIGILPGERRDAANSHVGISIATGLGHARNALVVMNGDAIIALEGGPGTLSELGHARVFEKPVAGLGTHAVEGLGIEYVDSAEGAVEYVEESV